MFSNEHASKRLLAKCLLGLVFPLHGCNIFKERDKHVRSNPKTQLSDIGPHPYIFIFMV